jgi:hypothetical protein
MLENLLPIGSVVLLKGGEKKLMIYGIKQYDTSDNNKEYDYIGVPYPEGHIGGEYQFLFNDTDISQVVFRGYENDERKVFIAFLDEEYAKGNFKQT